MLRKLLITIVGHVDHGKTTLLDRIRDSTVAEREAGLITQAIGASIIPKETIERLAGHLLKAAKIEVNFPGILAIDTPGHAAFSNLRKRGGSLADIAIVVININEGFMPQTIEAIEILRASKTPFIIAANKLDLVGGYQNTEGPILAAIKKQRPEVATAVDTKIYNIVGQLSEKFNMASERFDRVQDYTKEIAIVPVSAKLGRGIPELLLVLVGLTKKFLETGMNIEASGTAKGTVLEVKEEKGYGTTLDVILYDGHLKVNDTIVIGGLDQPVITKVKGLFEPAQLAEMRDKRTRFKAVKEVAAATGVKIIAKNIETVFAGMPMESVAGDEQAVIDRIQAQVDEVVIETDDEGIIVKADSLGSLEAMVELLRSHEVPIRSASIGPVNKKDVADAASCLEKDPEFGIIVCFNVGKNLGVEEGEVKIITSEVIYKILEDYDEWKQELQSRLEAKGLETLPKPFKLEVLKGYTFRQSNPAVFGVEVTDGLLKTNMELMNQDGKQVSLVKEIQLERKSVHEAEKGKQVAISVPNVTFGRQIKEGDILYSHIREEQFRKLKDLKAHLSAEQKELLRQIAEIHRRENPLWGM